MAERLGVASPTERDPRLDDPDYSPDFQDEYQRLWHQAAEEAKGWQAEWTKVVKRERELRGRVRDLETAGDKLADDVGKTHPRRYAKALAGWREVRGERAHDEARRG